MYNLHKFTVEAFEMKNCVVRLDRIQNIEQYRDGPLLRRSIRIQKLKIPKLPKLNLMALTQTPRRKISKQRRTTIEKSRISTPKSILKRPNSLRNRSKSVTFHSCIVSPDDNDENVSDQINAPTTNSVRRNLFATAQISQSDASTSMTVSSVSTQVNIASSSLEAAVPSCSSHNDQTDGAANGEVANYEQTTTDENLTGETASLDQINGAATGENTNHELATAGESLFDQTAPLEPNQVEPYERRIKSLVEVNRAKISRIKELVAEKSSLLKQIDTMHNINLSLTATVDLFRADEAANELNGQNAQILKLEEEINSLRKQVDQLKRENLAQRNENQRLLGIIGSYSNIVLAEHNYNM